MSLKSPNKEEKKWMDAIADFGCIVCHLYHEPNTPACVHHILNEGHRRMGHLYTIPLCYGHHNGNELPYKIARHPNKTRFVNAYGTELQLLVAVHTLLSS